MDLRRKLVFIALVAALLFPMYAFAAAQGEETGEKMEITFGAPYEDSWFMHELGDMFGVTVKGNGIAGGDSDLVQLMFASGEAPDAWSYSKPVEELWREGLIRSMPLDMIRRYAPNFTKIADERPTGWLIHVVPGKDNERFGIPTLSEVHNCPNVQVSFRIDQARKLGFDLETYDENKVSLDDIGRVYWLDESKDLQWFEDLLVAFRDGDADGNGKIDTIPMAASSDLATSWSSILGAFGLPQYPDRFNYGMYNHEENGKLILDIISQKYKAFLRHAARWYAMDLVDKEFPTQGTGQMRGKVLAGRIGVSFRTRANYIPFSVGRPPNSFATEEEVAQGAEVVMMPAPIGPGGFQGQGPSSNIPWTLGNPMVANSKVSDEMLEKILQIEDYAHWTIEGWVGYRFGKEGVFFNWSGEPYKSTAIRIPVEDIPDEYKFNDFPHEPQYNQTPHSATIDIAWTYMHPKVANWYVNVCHGERGEELTIHPLRWDLFAETGYRDLVSKFGAELRTMGLEFYFNVVTGEVDLDAEWDAYVARMLENGGAELLEAMEKAPLISDLIAGGARYIP